MTNPKTLLQLAGKEPKTDLGKSILVLIDYQNEYLDGELPLFEVEKAIRETRTLLDFARGRHIPVVHVVHRGDPGGIFDLSAHRGRIVESLQPTPEESVVEKTLPNSFAGTRLNEVIQGISGKDHLIVAGLMSHMCLQTTVTAAIDHGYFTTVVASTTTTRDLSGADGTVVPASATTRAMLAMLKDRFAVVVKTPEALF